MCSRLSEASRPYRKQAQELVVLRPGSIETKSIPTLTPSIVLASLATSRGDDQGALR